MSAYDLRGLDADVIGLHPSVIYEGRPPSPELLPKCGHRKRAYAPRPRDDDDDIVGSNAVCTVSLG